MGSFKKLVAVSTIGSVLEWYDFCLFGYIAPIISHVFFGQGSAADLLLMTFATFAVGFLVRPLGALYFGSMGDRKGRKVALSRTVLLMAIASTAIGCIPSYAQIGALSTIFLVCMRLLQGFSASGEYPNAVSFVSEMAPPHLRGYYASFALAGVIGGILLGSVTVTVISMFFNNAQFHSWGWRIPFLLSAPLGCIAFYLRSKMLESIPFQNLVKSSTVHKTPMLAVLRQRPKTVLFAGIIFTFANVAVYTIFVYFNSFLSNYYKVPVHTASLINSVTLLCLILLLPVCGRLSDRFGRQTIMLWGAAGTALFTYPLFLFLNTSGIFEIFLIQLMFAAMMALFLGPMIAYISEMFPTALRVSGIAISLNVSASLFGGTAPFIATWLIQLTGIKSAACVYLIIVAIVTTVSLLCLKKARLITEKECF